MPKIALALSGGGSRCIAQLGVMKYLEEQGIKISAISGSSGGSIVGGLYANGMSAEEIFQTLKEIDFKSHLKYNLKNGSIYHLRDAISYFQEIFGVIDIKDLKIPFYCTITDYENGEAEYKTSGDLVTLMMASSALVPIFAPVNFDDKVYVDGGFCDNLPSHPLKDISDYIIGINVNPVGKRVKYSLISHLKRSMFIMLHTNVRAGKKECDQFIEIEEMGKYSIFDLKNFELFFELGYNEAKKYKDSFESIYTKD